jgi:putative transposase
MIRNISFFAVRTAYKCRAYPDPEQAAVLNRTFRCVRNVWNEVLDWRTKRYRADRTRTGYAETDRYLTQLKKTEDLVFLSEVSSVPLQQALRHQSPAFANFFAKRARCPRYKSRNGKQSAAYTRSAFRMKDGELFLAKTPGALQFVGSWGDIDPAGLNPTTVTVSREKDGMWYVSFAVDTDDPKPLAATGEQVGLDLGIKDFAVTSDGERIANPRHLAKKRRNLARYERRKAHKQRGSVNRKKAARKVAVAHGKVRRAREDFLHKTSTELVRRYDTIVVEDLNVFDMVKNRKLARHIGDCGWGYLPHPAGIQGSAVGQAAGGHRPLVPLLQDVLALRAPSLQTQPFHPALDMPGLRHTARQGHQRREEHPGRRTFGVGLWS